MDDPLGVYLPNGQINRQDIALGTLAGLSFAVKDLFDVAGQVATCGCPDWAASHGEAESDAAVVSACLAAGATLTGRTIMDEMAYSLSGRNPHYGAPTNPNAPGCLTGGSSCGSVAAVAGGIADFALGTDTGGSIRIPASYCGVYGIRPTHGAVDLTGAMPLAPSFDTPGWFARDAATLQAVGDVLLPPPSPEMPEYPQGLVVAPDAFALADESVQAVLKPWYARLRTPFEGGLTVDLADTATGALTSWSDTFRDLQAGEAYAAHRAWVDQVAPRFGPEMAARWAFVTEAAGRDTAGAIRQRQAVRTRLESLTADGAVILVPSAPGVAPRIDADAGDLADHRHRCLTLTAPAGLAGLPQISLPLAQAGGLPVGVGLIGPRGSDRMLLHFATAFAERLERDPGTRFD